MPRIKIKQLDDRVATSGLHLGGGLERRKLQPGEIVEIPEGELFDTLWETGKVELTMDEVTRPLDYANYREAVLNSPTFRSRGPDEDREVAEARAAVEARMEQTSEVQSETESPADDTPPQVQEPPKNRRAARRAAVQAARNEQEVTA